MGDDFHNLHVFCNNPPLHAQLLPEVEAALVKLGYTATLNDHPDRSIAFSNFGRWTTLLDSSDNDGDPPDLQPFRDLAFSLSLVHPVVTVEVSDSAIVELALLNNGTVADQFANGRPPLYLFNSAIDAAPFRGSPAVWSTVLADTSQVALSEAFDQALSPRDILERAASALGLHPSLAACGYYVSYDGDVHLYSEHMRLEDLESLVITEQHYTRGASAA